MNDQRLRLIWGFHRRFPGHTQGLWEWRMSRPTIQVNRTCSQQRSSKFLRSLVEFHDFNGPLFGFAEFVLNTT